MTIQEAINFVDIARMNYICDPKGCGLEKGKDPCTAFHCDEMHDALVMAIEALEKQMPKKPRVTVASHNVESYWCANCGGYIANTYDDRIGTRGNNCKWCGQAIDWSDTE